MTEERIISGERFSVTYRISGNEKDALAAAKDICIEQTVEFPEELISDSFIRNNIFGRLESFSRAGVNMFAAEVSYAVEIAADEFTQFLNIILGNISLKPGIIIENIQLPKVYLQKFKGPSYGIQGVRDILNVYDRPLIASAIKPMGMSTRQFVSLAGEFTKGGIDIIKDDHGLSNQKYSDFAERVKACSDVINTAGGGMTLYFPNITAPFGEVLDRAYYAKENGAHGVLISPALTGFDCMKYLADDRSFNLPIMSHPSFIGSYLSGATGFTHGVLLGTVLRLAGADITVYPNFGGRFSFSKGQCLEIVENCRKDMGHIKPVFPSPGGGMNFSNIPEMSLVYGKETIYLMGGGLFKKGNDLIANCREFMQLVSKNI